MRIWLSCRAFDLLWPLLECCRIVGAKRLWWRIRGLMSRLLGWGDREQQAAEGQGEAGR